MKNWLKALLSETAFSFWWILSALSTLTTFVWPGWSGKPRLAFAISTMLGFAWANFRVFQQQGRRIASLVAELQTHRTRVSQLKITRDAGSRYILVPVGNVRNADFNGGFFEFHLMIENTGRRNSIVNNYTVEIVNLNKAFTNLVPEEGRNGVQGRHCQHALPPGRVLSKSRIIKIDAENATEHGTLLFFLPGLSMDNLLNAGLIMQGEQRRFGTLQCRLTLIDTTESSVTAEFELHED